MLTRTQVIVLGLALLTSACSTTIDWTTRTFGPNFAVKDDIGAVHVGVYPLLPLELLREEFVKASAVKLDGVNGVAVTGSDRLAHAVATSFLLGLQLHPSTAAAGAASAAPGQPKAPELALPTLAALAASAAGQQVGDHHLSMNVQAGLQQHAAWLASHIRHLEVPDDKAASIVTLHLSVLPRVRNAPVNAIVDLRFLCGAEKCEGHELEVQPLLMTDNLEANARELRARRSSGVGLGAAGAAGNVGYGLSAGRSAGDESQRLGHDLQGVMLTSFVAKDAVRLRLGAQVQPGAPNGYALLARSHVVSLLVLSPKGDGQAQKSTHLRVQRRYHFEHVLHGTPYCSKPASQAATGVRIFASQVSTDCGAEIGLAWPEGAGMSVESRHEIPLPPSPLLPPADAVAVAQVQAGGESVLVHLRGGRALNAKGLQVSWNHGQKWVEAQSVAFDEEGGNLKARFERLQGTRPSQLRLAWLRELTPSGPALASQRQYAEFKNAIKESSKESSKLPPRQVWSPELKVDIAWTGDPSDAAKPPGLMKTTGVKDQLIVDKKGRSSLTLTLSLADKKSKEPAKVLLDVQGAEVAAPVKGGAIVPGGVAVDVPGVVELSLRHAVAGEALEVTPLNAADKSQFAKSLSFKFVAAPNTPEKAKPAKAADKAKPKKDEAKQDTDAKQPAPTAATPSPAAQAASAS